MLDDDDGSSGRLVFAGGRLLLRRVLSFGFDIGRMSRDVAPAFRLRAFSTALDTSPFAAMDYARAHVLSETRAEPTREGSTFVRARRVGKDAPVVAPAGPPSPAAGRLPLRRRCLSSPRPRAGRPSCILCIFGKGRRKGGRRFRGTRRRSTKIWGRRRRVGFACDSLGCALCATYLFSHFRHSPQGQDGTVTQGRFLSLMAPLCNYLEAHRVYQQYWAMTLAIGVPLHCRSSQ